MKIIDTHSHLYSDKFHHDLTSVIERAQGVLRAVMLPNVSRATVPAMLDLVEKDDHFFFPMMGLHPSDVREGFELELEWMLSQLEADLDRYVGIGETGIDLYWDKTTLPLQQASLEIHIEWAKRFQLPIILHAREAIDEVIAMITQHADSSLKGIVHCFDGNIRQAQQILEIEGFKLGIGGIATYRKDVQAMLREVPLSGLVLETDSPYLPPVPHRKDKPRRNESSYTKYVATILSEIYGVSYEEVAEVTNKNAEELFDKVDWRKVG